MQHAVEYREPRTWRTTIFGFPIAFTLDLNVAWPKRIRLPFGLTITLGHTTIDQAYEARGWGKPARRNFVAMGGRRVWAAERAP